MSIFTENADKYWQQGYSVVPIAFNTKGPKLSGWQVYCDRLPNEKERKTIFGSHSNNCGIGFCLGEASGLIALDFDYDHDNVHDRINAILPPTPCGKIGKKGYTLFYRVEVEALYKGKKYDIGGKSVFEILGKGNQTVIPPTIHPETGKPYEWIDPKNTTGKLRILAAFASASVTFLTCSSGRFLMSCMVPI